MYRATGCRCPEPVLGGWPCRPPHRMAPWMSCELQEARWWLRVCVSRCKCSRSITVMKVETACSTSQSQLIVAGYTVRPLLLRLHSPIRASHVRGNATHQLSHPHPSGFSRFSASSRHFRLHPALRAFVSRVALLPRWLPHRVPARIQPVLRPTLLSRIFTTCRSVCTIA